jgi:quercetin dioxygenase-like cupin family protein
VLDQVVPYPEGVVLTALAFAPLDAVPANPATIQLERFTLAPGDRLTGATLGPRLIAVESGELRVERPEIESASYGPAQWLMIPPDEAATLSPIERAVTFLQFRIDPEAPDPPRLDSSVTPRVLLAGSPRLPRGEATISIVRLAIEPGGDTGQRVFSGPVGLAIESGTLTVVDLDGQPARLDAGGSLIAPSFTAHHLRNEGTAPVSGLAVAVLPTSPALAGAPVATPTPAVDLAATATIAALSQLETDLRGTIEARDTAEAELRATMAAGDAAAAAEVTNAQATTAAIALNAVELSAQLATAGAESMAAAATAASLQPTVSAQDAALGTASSQAASLAATAESGAIALASREAEAGLLGTRVSAAEQTISTEQEQALQAEATITAQAAALATVAAATVPAIDPNYREVMIESDVSGVAFGDASARNAVLAAVRQELQAEISQGCTAGLVLTFGYSSDVDAGISQAGAINELLAAEIPGMFGDSVSENFVNFEAPAGRAQIRVYLTTGCDGSPLPIATASPLRIATASPTSPPIVPTN